MQGPAAGEGALFHSLEPVSEGNLPELLAARKRIGVDAEDRIRDLHGVKPGLIEDVVFDFRQRRRDPDGTQRRAFCEGIGADGGQAFGEVDVFESGAALKGGAFDFRHRGRNHHVLEGVVIGKGPAADGFDGIRDTFGVGISPVLDQDAVPDYDQVVFLRLYPFGVFQHPAAEGVQPFRDRDAVQRGAVAEGVISHPVHAVGQADGLQRGAAGKGEVLNGADAVFKSQLRKGAAAGKSVFANGFHPSGDLDFFQGRAALKSAGADIGDIIRKVQFFHGGIIPERCRSDRDDLMSIHRSRDGHKQAAADILSYLSGIGFC